MHTRTSSNASTGDWDQVEGRNRTASHYSRLQYGMEVDEEADFQAKLARAKLKKHQEAERKKAAEEEENKGIMGWLGKTITGKQEHTPSSGPVDGHRSDNDSQTGSPPLTHTQSSHHSHRPRIASDRSDAESVREKFVKPGFGRQQVDVSNYWECKDLSSSSSSASSSSSDDEADDEVASASSSSTVPPTASEESQVDPTGGVVSDSSGTDEMDSGDEALARLADQLTRKEVLAVSFRTIGDYNIIISLYVISSHCLTPFHQCEL